MNFPDEGRLLESLDSIASSLKELVQLIKDRPNVR